MEEHHRGPAASCVSAHSLHSMGNPISFKEQSSPALKDDAKKVSVDQNQGPDSDSERIQQETLTSGHSCVSLQSDSSMERVHTFKSNTLSLESRAVQCCLPDGFSAQQRAEFKRPVRHSPIMTELQMRIEQFMDHELEHLDRILSEESEEVPEQRGDKTDDEDTRRNREAVIHLCTHFLRVMKEDDLAQRLLKRTKIAKCVSLLKSNLKKRFQHVFEGVAKAGHQTDLNEIYTDLWITEGHTGGVTFKHEVCFIQTASHRHQERSIRCQDIFDSSLHGGQSARTLLTKGVAGIGKTMCVHKVLLDWIEHKAHYNIRFILPFSFRELNVLRGRSFSVMSLVHHFFRELKEAEICNFDDESVVLIFDGLDESRSNLDFQNSPSLTDIRESVPLDVLLVNLIRGKLLPSTRLWITSRPAAASQIPAECVSIVTEVRGFTNPQKEQYFRKRFRDEQQATTIISHMRSHPSLHFMCYIPIFCWIFFTVQLHLLEIRTIGQLPQTLTQMFIHFLVVQTKVKSVKYDGRSELDSPWSPETRKMVESLGKLAFEQLQKGNLIFYESDLNECGLDAAAASKCSGFFTQIFREEPGLYQDKVYCFVHLSVQEFLAALHVHLTFFNTGVNLLSEEPCPTPRLKPVNDSRAENFFYLNAVNKALQSSNGHLDLFLRFLLGLSRQSNQNLLQGLMKHIQPSSNSSREAVAHVKDRIMEDLPSDKNINLIHCLNELGEQSLLEEMQNLLSCGHLSAENVSFFNSLQWSTLVFILLLDTCDVFELKRFYCSEDAFFRLLPVIKESRESSLRGCSLSSPCWNALAAVLKSESCLINKLDLRYTELQDEGLSTLTEGMSSLLKKLKVLRIRGCRLTKVSCRSLGALLSSPLCVLTELDVSDNLLQDCGLSLLSEGLQSSHCKLTTLRLDGCDLTSRSCEQLSAVLQCQTSVLRNLDLSNNPLQDSGIELLCTGLLSPHCSLEILRLSGCLITEKGFILLKRALTNCHLEELDLRYNHLGINILSVAHEHPPCNLTTLRTGHGGAHCLKPGLEKYACELTVDLNTAHSCLMWFENNCFTEDDTDMTQHQEGPDNFDFWHQVVCNESLTGHSYWEVKWRGCVSIAVTYKGIQRKGNSPRSMLGGNSQSWALDCSSKDYFAWHNNIIEKHVPRKDRKKGSRQGAANTIGVYLDWEEGVLSFFSVLPDGLKLIHSFHSSFSEPLLPAFRLRSEFTLNPCNIVTLCPLQT